MNNFFLVVLDGVGIGELPDAADYNDAGSNTICNIARVINGLNLPNLQSLGLGNITKIEGISDVGSPIASFGKMTEISKGKDSTTGHWELGGIFVNTDFSYFPEGFPDSLIKKFIKKTGCENILGNKPASGTEIIKELGQQHIQTGYPIVYTSADSVFQIAAHEKVIPLERLYEICSITRNEVLTEPLNVGRVIARPFIGEFGNFIRTTNRKDFSLDPPQPTILDILSENKIETVAIGKVNDLFNYRGISVQEITKTNDEGCLKLLHYAMSEGGVFVFANLVDFDVNYGHRNDPEGFALKLKEFDDFLPELLDCFDDSDRLIITADHGNDPTTPSTDHSREYVPLLFYGKDRKGKNLGTRKTFSDAGKTAAEFFNIENNLKGISFLNE